MNSSLVPIMMIFAILVFTVLLNKIYKNRQFKKESYYQITKNSYSSVKRDKGKYGEYLAYKSLRHLEGNGAKFLFNVYIPNGNNGTTEIDMLLICSKGIFVFECKNYGGWIFGNEAHKNWTQTLPMGRGYSQKEYFYNPIMQNAWHIRHLKKLVGYNVPMPSIIVFSDRCTLMDITVNSVDVIVINHSLIQSVVAEICDQIQDEIYTEAEVCNVYNKLYPYTQVYHDARDLHTMGVRRRFCT